ncbi:hypothetical protein FB451DRAFT_1405235 [Mycena latifolia]|nr:hypothetical protein FB451DRAFT_1405235 [Mycena latifolia]
MQTVTLPIVCSAAPPKKQHRRRRTLSSVSVPPAGSGAPKIKIAALPTGSTSTAHPAAAGAFTLTGCARAALRCFTPGKSSPYMYDDDADEDDSPPASPTSSFASVPSISRTASPCEGERAPIPPGWGARPSGKREREWAQEQKYKHKQRGEWGPPKQYEGTRIHPVLDALERGSRVGTGRVACAACKKPGTNFPRCTRCARVWCSRECRTSPVHRCAPRRAQTIK